MRCFYPLAIVLACFAAPAHAGGINLAWDDCGTQGLMLKNFACDTNTGAEVLVASFVSPAPLTQMVALEGFALIAVSQPTISPWWDFSSTGCRANRLSWSANFTLGPYTCVDPWAGNAAGGLAVTNSYVAPNVVWVRTVQALPNTITVDDVTEYYAFKLILANGKTIGAGSCGGCQDAACIVLQTLRLDQPQGVGDYTVSTPLYHQDAYWQCSGSMVTDDPWPCQTSCPVPAKNRTWGHIKSLYH
jgi:hypothetical protein